jgi:chromosome segregation ATPase
MRVTELDLAREDVDVLREVRNQDDGRGVTTGEIRQMLGWAEENHHVNYRLEKLEERGLVGTEKDPERGPNNQLPPKVAYVTEEGEQLVEEVEYQPEDKALVERVERIENQMGTMRDTYGEVKQRIVEIEERLDEYDEDLDDLAEELRNLRRSLPDENGGGLATELEFGDD